MKHAWLKGDTATEHDLLPEIKQYLARARLKRGVEMVRLANRIQALRMQADEDGKEDLPESPGGAAAQAAGGAAGSKPDEPPKDKGARRLSRAARSAIFREVVLAKVRDMKEQEKRDEATKTKTELEGK